MAEKNGKEDGDDQRISSKGCPNPGPVELDGGGIITYSEKLLDDPAADPASQEGAETIGHHHEQTLSACPDARFALGFHEE